MTVSSHVFLGFGTRETLPRTFDVNGCFYCVFRGTRDRPTLILRETPAREHAGFHERKFYVKLRVGFFLRTIAFMLRERRKIFDFRTVRVVVLCTGTSFKLAMGVRFTLTP